MSTHDEPRRILGQFLRDRSDELVTRWSRAIKRDNPLLAAQPEASVVNAMGLFVEQVAAALGAGEIVRDSRVAQSHGEHRQASALQLGALIGEYVTFLDIACVVAEEHDAPLDSADMLALARCVLVGAAESAHAYALMQERAGRRRDAEHFAFLAHDLRNPLAVVRMAWQLLRAQGLLPTTEPVRLIERSLVDTIALLDGSLSQMRDRVELGAAAGPLEPHDVGALVRAAVDTVALAAHGKDVEVVLDEHAPLTVLVDPRLITAALVNLLHNAIKHGRRGGRIDVSWQADHGQVVLTIADDGPGISPKVAERIYEAFNAGTGEQAGFGLGLAIVKQAIEAHGGSVHVENRSAPLTGCVFKVLLELAPDGAC